ncbi:phosphotransferase [bacterium]|nr:phosphotransferase [bacterium]
MKPSANTLPETLQVWLSGRFKTLGKKGSFQIQPLAGDGSPRPFYRVVLGDTSYVLLTDAAWTLSQDYPPHQAYLEKLGLPVPKFLAWDQKLGVLLMEDLGDTLLQEKILQAPAEKLSWLEKATQLVAELHGRSFPVPKELPVATRHFDAAKYSQELGFTYEHLIQGYFKLPAASLDEQREVGRFCSWIGGFGPETFSHRDYHTRNLLVHGGQLRLIDFQDARMGPIEYDLASLFYDPYVPVDARDRERLIQVYQQTLKPYALSNQITWADLPERLHAVGLQRMVKAAGSFASFFTRYGKTTHLRYITPALQTALDLHKSLGSKAPKLPIAQWLEHSKKAAP